ncbi:unnamed protein product [Ectocarpus sp. 4 AP-2014]
MALHASLSLPSYTPVCLRLGSHMSYAYSPFISISHLIRDLFIVLPRFSHSNTSLTRWFCLACSWKPDEPGSGRLNRSGVVQGSVRSRRARSFIYVPYSGCLPARRLLEKYDLLIFDDFSTAIRQGNLKRFSLLMKQHERALILSDLLPHLEGCRLMVYRQVLKQIATATDANVLPFKVIVLGLVLRGHEFDIDNDSFDPQQSAEERELARWDEVTFILAGLIMDGLISGVVRSRDAQLLLSKKTGFPDLPEITETGLRPRLRPRPRPLSRHLRSTSTFNILPVKVELLK